MKGLLVRGSEIQDFLRCRKRWYWRWVEGLEPRAKNGKLWFGDLMHKYLETLYRTREYEDAYAAMECMYQETNTEYMDQVEVQELWTTAQHVASNYFDEWWGTDSRYTTLATEFTFAVPVRNGIVYTGTIDWLFLDEYWRLCISDHKNTSSIDKYDKNSDMDRQISRYWWAMQQLASGRGYVESVTIDGEKVWTQVKKHPIWKHIKGKEVFRFYYNIILRDYPEPPKVLKDGSLSKDKRQKTTYELYWKVLTEKYGIASVETSEILQNEYGEFLEYLKAYPREFFRRLPVIRNQQEIDAAIEEFYQTALDIKALRKKLRPEKLYRNITTDCSWDCPFRDVCAASLDGSDVEFLIEQQFTKEELVV